MRKHGRTQTFLLILLGIFLTVSPPDPSAAATNCSDADRDHASAWNNYYDPEEAYEFGRKIQKRVLDRNIDGLFDLVEGELSNGPRKRFVQNRAFDSVFSDDWRSAVLGSMPPCRPVGSRGFMLSRGLIWFDYGSRKSGAWSIFSINGAIREDAEPAGTAPAWRVAGEIVPPRCFATIWMSGDNFEAFEKIFEIRDKADFRRNTGKYLGNEIDHLDPVDAPWGKEKISLAVFLDRCMAPNPGSADGSRIPLTVGRHGVASERCDRDGNCVEQAYRLLAPVSLSDCQTLAPHLPGRCLSAYLVRVVENDIASGVRADHYGIYGHFRLDDGRDVIAPLVNFSNENDARNFVDDMAARH